jgi:hypothetical protein
MKIKNCIKSIVITSFVLLVFLCLSGCAKTKQEMLDAGLKQMTTQELTSLFSDKKIAKVYNVKKRKWYTYTYLPDGSISAERNGRVRTSIYYIKNDRICSKKRLESRKKRCSSWIRIDAQTFNTYAKDGSLVEEISFQ